MAIAGDASGVVHTVVTSFTRALSQLSLFDWVLVGVIVLTLAWAWVRAMAFARLGTIQIEELTFDDGKSGKSVKALLQDELSNSGLPPHSSVPNGAPSPTSLAAAVAEAPIDQAKWLSALIGLIPFPPSNTGFTVTGTLLTDAENHDTSVGLAYQLIALGPRKTVQLAAMRGPDWETVIPAVAGDIYRKIVEGAPELYPLWSRWSSAAALDAYHKGLKLEKPDLEARPNGEARTVTERYSKAYECYRQASDLDPDNMLARLRAANCLERIAAGIDRDQHERCFTAQVRALQAYLSIRLREKSIFEAGFRASVLLSGLANNTLLSPGDEDKDKDEYPLLPTSDLRKLTVLLDQHELRTARYIDDYDLADSGPLARAFNDPDSRPRGSAGTLSFDSDEEIRASLPKLRDRLKKAAAKESRLARWQLLPAATFVHGRFRHRFEPRGSERRRLLKALRMARWVQRARGARRKERNKPGSVREIAQLGWRLVVFWRYTGLRFERAGWAAHYNAACFYALLPQAWTHNTPFGGMRFRRRALKHLRRAVDYSDGALACSWVRDEDRDLDELRRLNPHRFANAIAPICPDVATIHYRRPASDGEWKLHAWGEAIAPSDLRRWEDPLSPAQTTSEEKIFRVKIFDENHPLYFLAHTDTDRDIEHWLIPAECPGCEAWVTPRDPKIEGPVVVRIVTIHYIRKPSTDGWKLHLWGDALLPNDGRHWDRPVQPLNQEGSEAVFKVRLFDESKTLRFIAHNGVDEDTERSLVPKTFPSLEIWAHAGDPAVYPGPPD